MHILCGMAQAAAEAATHNADRVIVLFTCYHCRLPFLQLSSNYSYLVYAW